MENDRSEIDEQSRLWLASAALQFGLWDWNMVTGDTVFNDRWAEIVGYELEEIQPGSFDTGVRFAHPDDLEKSQAAIADHLEGRAPFYTAEVRMHHRDGHWVWVHVRGRVVEWNDAGEPTRMVGTHEDVTSQRHMLDALQASEQRFSSMFHEHGAAMLLIDPTTGEIVDANPAAADFYGYSIDVLKSMLIQDINALDDHEVGKRRQAVLDGTNRVFVFPHRLADGTERIVEVHSSPFVEDGRTLLFSIIHDVTDRVEFETQRQTAAIVFDNALESLVVMDPDTTITSVNPAFTTLTGWTAEGAIGRPARFLDASQASEDEDARMLTALMSGEGYRAERRILCADGSVKNVQLSINAVLRANGTLISLVAQISDLEERVEAERQRLDTLMSYDQATGLPNRHLFLDQLDVELKVQRRSQRGAALLLLNLDRFKEINEAFGFASGELVMTIVADRLQTRLRAGDLLARHSGDEFAILLNSIRTRSEIDAVARHLLSTLDDVLHVPGAQDVFITACIGAIPLPGEVTSAEQAMQRATAALHTAKAQGPGTVQQHLDGLGIESRERLVRVAQIKQAWTEGEFRLDYQPIFHVATGELSGAEALMRWRSPLLGDIPPLQFIPLAEDVGLITEMGTWAIQEVCRQGAEWARHGLDDITVSVNVTAQQLAPETFATVVQQSLDASGFPASRLILELTESTLLNAGGDTIELMARLGQMGVRVALDDFGTGYSSFAYLRQYPLNKLKIDRSFITGIETDPRARSIVAAIIDMGHHLGLKVLAEGVEEQPQLDVLKELGCDLYQGFLRSRAIPADLLLEQALTA